MSKMSNMAMTIEELRSAAAAINEAASWLAEQFSGTADKAPAKEPAAKEEKKTELKLENVRAVLSASSSDRWLHCPPSARLCETYEDKGSDYAAEGTDAHELCEYKLKRALGMDASDPTENLTWYNEEMEDCANGYAAYILEMVEAAEYPDLP